MPFGRPYERFGVVRPQYLSDEYWMSVEAELFRLDRSLSADDFGQAIGDLKCLVESIAKIALDINGTPVASNANFDTTVNKAHELLRGQPGHEITNESEYGKIATQASKIARNLGNIRNDFGSGHGRARQPQLNPEMIDLGLDGGLLWARWALRRLGLFAEGRPSALIRDLIVDQATFYSGDIRRRLESANLPALEPQHQRALGVAVAQRAMGGTFVVNMGGVTPCLESDDTTTLWTREYRLGLAHGLLFDVDERPTVGEGSLRSALRAFDPLPDCTTEVEDLVDRVILSTVQGQIVTEVSDSFALKQSILERVNVRPAGEAEALKRLANHVQPHPF